MKRNQNPDWYKLTKLLKLRGEIITGLTIPYIFGAYKLLGKPFENISALLDELRKYQIDKYPVIQKCGTIHQHVIAVEDKHIYHKDHLNDIKLYNANKGIDLVISSNTELGKNEEMIYKNLTRLYKDPIDAGKYSWNNTIEKWKPFEEKEEKLILSLNKN